MPSLSLGKAGPLHCDQQCCRCCDLLIILNADWHGWNTFASMTQVHPYRQAGEKWDGEEVLLQMLVLDMVA
jgi:hypothetical protein